MDRLFRLLIVFDGQFVEVAFDSRAECIECARFFAGDVSTEFWANIFELSDPLELIDLAAVELLPAGDFFDRESANVVH